MRIVSQSKDSSFDFDRTVFCRNGRYIFAYMNDVRESIGSYRDSKQTEEVFIQMNQESTSTKIFFMPEK